jgi:hypothetical protein
MATTVEPQLGDRASGGVLPPSPAGTRLRERQWRDPRLIVGLLLVVASVLGVVWVVSASDETVGVWVVRTDVSAGNPITSDDVEVGRVQVPDQSLYLAADDPLPVPLTATRDFARGELLTQVGTIVDGEPRDVRLVTLPVLTNQMPANVGVGSRVDVYVVERTASGEPEAAPRLVLADALVSGVDDDSGAFGGNSLEIGVALAVPSERVPDVVDAQARGTVTLVDVPIGSS